MTDTKDLEIEMQLYNLASYLRQTPLREIDFTKTREALARIEEEQRAMDGDL